MEDNVKPKLTQWADRPQPSSRRITQLEEATAIFFDLTLEQLRSETRTNELVWPRSVCMWLSRDAGLTLQSVGDRWGRHHSTVVNAIKLVNDLREQKPAYDKQFRLFVIFLQKHIKRDGLK